MAQPATGRALACVEEGDQEHESTGQRGEQRDDEHADAERTGDLFQSRHITTVAATCYGRNMTTGDAEPVHWLLVSITTGADASLRVHVWRQLRKLGAVYLQNSVCMLPDVGAVPKTVQRLAARVNGSGGKARVLHTAFTDPAEQAAIVAQQRADRDTEYGEVVERTPAFLAEITHETARGRATYAEVEESEADLERFEKWLASIAARDYFRAGGGQAARDAVQACRDVFTAFEAAALAADTGAPQATIETPRLRVVDNP